MSGLLEGKRGLIMGVANERSIAWGIAKAMAGAGAELAFTYQGEAFGTRLKPLAESVGSDFMVDVDVTDDASLDAAFDQPPTRISPWVRPSPMRGSTTASSLTRARG